MISNISIDKLIPHPNNPRKQLGDLSELAESIKTNGVFQNLTVVDNGDDTYTIIIGHRRTAAAKLAGLTELPCAIVEMSENEQLATMLLENMQRSDLTVYEQAQGFQLMLNLGETVESISDKTGFGKSTIYKRVKLCQLDKDKFLKGQERGATLEDYAKLDKITDPELKNRALDSIGTVNFDNAVRTAVADERYNAKLVKWETLLSSFANRVAQVDISKYSYVKNVYMSENNYDSFVIPADADEVEYIYTIGNNSWDKDSVRIYKENTKNSLEQANEEAERKRKEEDRQLRFNKIKETAVSFSKARAEFIKNYYAKTIMESEKVAGFYLKFTNSVCTWYGIEGYDRIVKLKKICDFIGFDYAKYKDKLDKGNNLFEMMELAPELGEQIESNQAQCMLAFLYIKIENCYGEYYIKTWDYEVTFCELTLEEQIYLDLLEFLGYQMSDEERSLYDGTHELYTPEEVEEFIDVDDIPDVEEDE